MVENALQVMFGDMFLLNFPMNSHVICSSLVDPKPQCVSDNDCSRTEKCQGGTCVLACNLVQCGLNARCVSDFHSANCQCNRGYFGDPYSYCEAEKIEPPSLTTGCASDNDCPDYTACENRKCINPCAERDPCARNAYCKVIRHQPVCTCPDGYIGDPTTSCELRKYPF